MGYDEYKFMDITQWFFSFVVDHNLAYIRDFKSTIKELRWQCIFGVQFFVKDLKYAV